MKADDVDWRAVQAFYDAGHTLAECRERFGFTDAAWDRAKRRGEIRPRPRGGWSRPHDTRQEVSRLLAEGRTYAEIASALRITKSTVSYHARKLGIPPDERFSKRVDWDRVQRAHDDGLSVRECAERFGFNKASWHKAVKRGDLTPRSHLIPLEELLVPGRKTNRGHLKQRLLAAGLKVNRCEQCGISEWLDLPLSLQVHHKNGDGLDNRLDNLQLLCPNCHSQTDTYGGRNGHRRPERHLRLVTPEERLDEEAEAPGRMSDAGEDVSSAG